MKKIIPTLAMFLLVAALLCSSTFAWFSMNTSVSATGMQVTANSDSIFLVIAAGKKTTASAVGSATTATATTASANVYPAAHETIAKISDADTASKWYTGESDSPSSATLKTSSKTALTDANMANYVLVNDFTLTVASGSKTMSDIKCDCTITVAEGGDKAVKVLVATATAVEEFSGEGGTGSVVLQSSLTSSDVMYVKVYVYIDGDDSDVTTNNVNDLKATSVSLSFSGTASST